MQHMVQAVELMGALNGFYIPRGFHHADHGTVRLGEAQMLHTSLAV